MKRPNNHPLPASENAPQPAEYPSKAPSEPQPYSRKSLGYLFSVVIVAFVGVFAYLSIGIIGPMTRPSSYFDRMSEAVHTKASDTSKVDKQTVQLVILMEYANADIRLAGVQIAFALVGGLFFAAIGVLLLAASLMGNLQLDANTPVGTYSFGTVAPGVACLVFGAVIISFGVMRDIRKSLQAELTLPERLTITESGSLQPPPPKTSPSNPDVTKAEKQLQGTP